MLIAILQFAPEIGEIASNVKRAERLLQEAEDEGRLDGIDILVLPEMAFTGYNHPSLSAITPFLEPTTSGLSTRWAKRTAQRLKCIVAVGYPERTVPEPQPIMNDATNSKSIPLGAAALPGPAPDLTGLMQEFKPSYYNALVFVSPKGQVIAHYRKSFLYYTDETWASEGPAGFFTGQFPFSKPTTNGKESRNEINIAAGICMDINPHKFQAPWEAFEFANHCLETGAKLVVLSMAWLTRLEAEEMEAHRDQPDLSTVGYWIERFTPLHRAQLQLTEEPKKGDPLHDQSRSNVKSEDDAEVIVIFANRAGEEGTAPLIGDVRYAGSSCVMGIERSRRQGEDGKVRLWDILGRGTEGVLVVDTKEEAMYRLRTKVRDTTRV